MGQVCGGCTNGPRKNGVDEYEVPSVWRARHRQNIRMIWYGGSVGGDPERATADEVAARCFRANLSLKARSEQYHRAA